MTVEELARELFKIIDGREERWETDIDQYIEAAKWIKENRGKLDTF